MEVIKEKEDHKQVQKIKKKMIVIMMNFEKLKSLKNLLYLNIIFFNIFFAKTIKYIYIL